jgi:molecular chaperone DnaJ
MTLLRSRTEETLYDLLGVPPASSARAVRDAYYALARELHPDQADGEVAEKVERFKAVALAYGTLKNAEFRARYDTRLRLERRLDCQGCGGAGLRSGFERGRYLKDQPCKLCGGKGHV